MKITCEKETLLKAVTNVGRLATTRATLPILQNIFLQVKGNILTVKATDLEQTLEIEVDGTSAEPGSTTIPARVLNEYLQNNSDQSITIQLNDTTLLITSANHQAKIKGMAAEDYPDLPKITFQNEITLPSTQLSEAITKIIFAAANDETRPVLTGLLFRFEGEVVTIVATDGYRLAYTKLPTKTTVNGDYILPKRSLQELLRLLANSNEVVISFSATQARLTIGEKTFITRILEGTFPPYESIIPKKSTISVTVSSNAVSQSLKLASLFSRDSAYSAKLEVTDKKIKITAISPSLGENSNEVPIENGPTEPLIIALNAQYLIDALAVMSGDVILSFTDDKSPLTLTLPKNKDYLYLLMPLRKD